LFEIITRTDIQDHSITREFYVEWEKQFGGDELSPDEAGKLEISASEMRWVVLSALQHQLKQGREVDALDSEAVLISLQGNGFCPALETYVEAYADPIFKAMQSPAPRF
jgi:hypothetical protein